MRKKLTLSIAALAILGCMHLATVRADEPKPDPSGHNTGAASDAADASNTPFIISAPAELTGDDKSDTNKVAAYNTAKKAYDDFTTQSKAEPLAMRLADSV